MHTFGVCWDIRRYMPTSHGKCEHSCIVLDPQQDRSNLVHLDSVLVDALFVPLFDVTDYGERANQVTLVAVLGVCGIERGLCRPGWGGVRVMWTYFHGMGICSRWIDPCRRLRTADAA